jgi:hypothetical protein
MKSTLNLPAENQLEFDIFYDEDEHIFDQEKRQVVCRHKWTSRVDTLTWLLQHYGKVFDILQEFKYRAKKCDILMPPHVQINTSEF